MVSLFSSLLLAGDVEDFFGLDVCPANHIMVSRQTSDGTCSDTCGVERACLPCSVFCCKRHPECDIHELHCFRLCPGLFMPCAGFLQVFSMC